MSQSPFPPDLINQLRIFAVLAQFRLQYDRGRSPLKTSVPSVPMPISFSNIPSNIKGPLYWIDVEPPEPIPNGGIIAGEIIGHRCWRIMNDKLWSMIIDYYWIPHKFAEGDVKNDGVHSFKEVLSAMYYAQHSGAIVVIGTIKMWGEVVEHERGYRAQYARINSLDKIFYPSWFRNSVDYEKVECAQLSKLHEIYGCTS
jgi:hypothetical protein